MDINNDILHEQYGVCCHFERHFSKSEWVHNDSILTKIEDLGVNYIRTDFNWSSVQPTLSSSYSFGHIDTLFNYADFHSLKVLPILDYCIPECMPVWRYQDAWNNYCFKIIERYKDKITHAEIWNEENNDEFWPSPSASRYSKFFLNTRNFIKSHKKHVQLINGGLAGYDFNYLKQLLDNDMFEENQVVAIHYSSGAKEPENIIEQEIHRKTLFEQYGADKPIWLTETSYSTGVSQDFFDIFIPAVCEELNMQPKEVSIGLLYDSESSFAGSTILEDNLFIFKNTKKIDCCDLINVDPIAIPIIIPSVDESFPIKYFDGLLEYVRKGGTIINLHGLPFYYDCSNYNGRVSKYRTRTKDIQSLYKKLHIDYIFSDNPSANLYNLDFEPKTYELKSKFLRNFKTNVLRSSRFLLANNLSKGDSLIPLVLAKNDLKEGVISGIYKLNSELKGNIVLFTNLDFYPPISEKIKAERIPRLFLCAFSMGIEKIFLYEILSKELDITNKEHHFGILNLDLSPKPSFYTYRTLIRMLPNESSRPKLDKKDGVYKAEWVNPNGHRMAALWSITDDMKNPFNIHPKKVYNQFGELIKWSWAKTHVGTSVVYLEIK